MGFLAAFIKELLEDNIFILPSIVKTNKGKGLRLGCISSFLMGIIAAILADKDPSYAFACAFAAPTFLEKLFKKTNNIKKEGDENADEND
jgi:hypothetical protein